MSQFPWEKWERKNDVFDLRISPTHCSLSLFWAFSVLKHEGGELSRSGASLQRRGVREMCCHGLCMGFFPDSPLLCLERAGWCSGKKTEREPFALLLLPHQHYLLLEPEVYRSMCSALLVQDHDEWWVTENRPFSYQLTGRVGSSQAAKVKVYNSEKRMV